MREDLTNDHAVTINLMRQALNLIAEAKDVLCGIGERGDVAITIEHLNFIAADLSIDITTIINEQLPIMERKND